MLLDSARNARARLIRAEAASSGIEEADALAAKRDELTPLAARVVMLAQRNTLLRNEGISLTAIPDIEKVKQVISQIRNRFAESPKSTTLVDSKRWSKLVTALTEFSASAETLQKQDWRGYFNSKLFGGLPPEQRRQTILQTLPENHKALERYTYLYQRFIQHRNAVPSHASALSEVHACSKELADIRFVENDDVPGAVKAFFDATSHGAGASLELLTAEVVEWLRTNNMLANYVVRAR